MKWGLLPEYGLRSGAWFAGIFTVAFFGGWLVWAFQVPRWRLWAYERVENISRLKEEAIAAQLIWEDSSIFTKTEIASRELRAKIRALEDAQRILRGAPNKSLGRTREG
jgi:hypothetical protein